MLDRPLTFVGPSVSLVTTVHDCFFLTLTSLSACANSFSMALVSGDSFFDGLAALPGVVSIADSDHSDSDVEAAASLRNDDPGNECPPEDLILSSSASEWERA